MNPSNENSSETDSDDEWFYDSIQRYDDLLMYELQGSLSAVCFQNRHCMLAASSRECHNEVLQLMLPQRLTATKDVGLIKNRDFKVIRAGYLKSKAFKIVIEDDLLISSEADAIKLYTLPHSKDEDVIDFNRLLRSSISRGLFCIEHSSEPFCISGTNLADIQRHSLLSGDLTQSFSFNGFDESKHSSISFLGTSPPEIFVGLEKLNCFVIFDCRVGSVVQCLRDEGESLSTWIYNISSDHNKVASMSCSNTLAVFDRRKIDTHLKNIQFPTHCLDREKNIVINFSPCDKYLSVSGWDKVVRIYDSCDFIERFTHDGHRAKGVDHLTTHLWHPDIDNALFSCDNTGILQAWKFKLERN